MATKTHYLKCVQPFFEDVLIGRKKFEHRRDDREFDLFDIVILQEYNMQDNSFSGREVAVYITYILRDRAGLDSDFCIFSFEKIYNKHPY